MLLLGADFQSYLDSISGLIQWPIQDLPPSTTALAKYDGAFDSSYDGTHTGVTLGQPFGGNIPYAGSYDGNNDYTDIYSAALNSIWTGSAGSVIGFVQMNGAGVWTDGINRSILTIRGTNSAVDTLQIQKTSTNNQLLFQFRANSVNKFTFFSTSTIECFMYAMTWDTTADELIYYINKAPITTDTSIGTWVNALSTTECIIGALNTGAGQPHHGLLTTTLVHPTRALSGGEIKDIGDKSGVC
jgi:hypothetical protein